MEIRGPASLGSPRRRQTDHVLGVDTTPTKDHRLRSRQIDHGGRGAGNGSIAAQVDGDHLAERCDELVVIAPRSLADRLALVAASGPVRPSNDLATG